MKIPQINTVIEFELTENVLLIIAGALKTYQNKNNAKVQILNVPQTIPPDAPRIVISTPNALIRISLTRFEINSKIPNHIYSNFESSLIFTKATVKSVLDTLMVPELKYSWVGLVCILEFPISNSGESALKLSEKFFDKLVNIKRASRDLSSFEIKFGYKENNFYKNFAISGYETRDIKIELLHQQGIQVIDLEKHGKITDAGLRIILDVNNRPAIKSPILIDDLELVYKEINLNYNSLLEDLNIKDLL